MPMPTSSMVVLIIRGLLFNLPIFTNMARPASFLLFLCCQGSYIGMPRVLGLPFSQVEMLADDWLNMTRTEGRSIEDNHPSLRLDLLGPLLHHDDGKDRLLGVLCIGNPSSRPRDFHSAAVR